MARQENVITFKSLKVVALAVASIHLTGCLAFDSSSPAGTKAYDVNLYPANKLVCDPLDPSGGHDPGLHGGLKADLYYLQPSQPRYYSVKEIISYGKKSDQFFFFSEINVPTRLFTMGFPLEAGGIIKNDEGEDLIEFFALSFTTVLKLDPDQPEGEYELALLSDDGAILSVREDDGIYREYVNNDDHHPTRLGCGTKRLNMTRDSEHLVRIDYYQGPRYHISLIPMWRRVTPDMPKETACGQTGNELWFDYNNNSKPTANYQALLNRGWRPIAANNYEIPATYYMNPCVDGIVPVISNASTKFEGSDVIVEWSTDIRSTSQVRFINEVNGEDRITAADNTLRTSHSVRVSGLRSGDFYYFQPVSISDTYGKAFGGFIRLRVP